ncbi:MAG: hypothetical protein A3F54_05145 [Candidatus Kerfeldbacteria bacterium RIFCSPHIGHO2_12_FULL_48_17]|uniref:UMP kinase n=1 Tax=Candidatus Kerfeldbacteria bacterium RIFCSPHIGHO2_12_FULL_48_17 TaxID=1798542 RepID=A0A1G2B671_9BACT|nr:MAG: hypothetical protein A3F54_05145 [Candidatus Kerfeldbacteria bacterium RIFCSPHIGHO2_12_FULL_48_17]
MKKETFVISLGGSLIVPDEIDAVFLKKFVGFIRKELAGGRSRFVIITGGGRTTRRYQEATRKIAPVTSADLDWVGLYASRLNAQLLRVVFGKDAYGEIITRPWQDVIPRSYGVVVAAGWKPGWSTDYIAVQLAKRVGAKRVLNLSNVARVYEKDPRKYPQARSFNELSWPAFRKIVGNVWRPGLSVPFDPIASQLAEKAGLEVIIVDGHDLANVGGWMRGSGGEGTIIV